MPPEELVRRLQAGEPALECGLPCRDAWHANRATALLLNEARQWRELAILVMQIGYTNDLIYFYLGRAAQGLGFWDAAKTYYRISVRLASAGITCRAEGADYCNGQVFPAAAQAELAELTTPPPTPPKQPSKTQPAQHPRRPPAIPAPSPASASKQITAPTSTGSAVAPEAASPDFAAPPPVRR